MIRHRAVFVFLIFLVMAISSDAVAAAKYQVRQDAQAVAVAAAAFTAMGGAKAIAMYQDSVASGTVTIYTSDNPVTYAITMKSKGLRETRSEFQLPKGTNVRIVNQGQGVIVRPDGSIRNLDSNNTFYEHVNHIPLLSLLAEYANGSVNLIYQGSQQVQKQMCDVIEIDFVPTDDPAAGQAFATMSRTLIFVNQTTRLVDKIQSTPLYEGNDKTTLTVEDYLADYRSVNGLLVPFHQTTFLDGKLNTDITFTSISVNLGLADSEFALPQAR